MTEAQRYHRRILIVALPDVKQNVFQEMFASRQDVIVVGIASGCLAAVSMIHRVYPDVVVIDYHLPEPESAELIRLVKAENPFVRSLLLVETIQQLTKADQAGADIALTAYSVPESLAIAFGNMHV